MAAFLPALIAGIFFMAFLEKFKLQEKSVNLFLYQIVQKFSYSKGLEIVDLMALLRCQEKTVQMVFRNDIAVDLVLFMGLPPEQGIKDDLYGFVASENGSQV